MFTLLIALAIRHERFAPVRMGGVILGITAIVLLIGPDTSLPEPEKAVFVLIAFNRVAIGHVHAPRIANSSISTRPVISRQDSFKR